MVALPEPQLPDIRVEYVTPQLAYMYLEHNTNNRSVSSRQVDKYAHAMASGDWQLSDSIKFDTHDRLIDGQHRLMAIVQAGVTVPLFVARNLDPSAQDVIDTGRARTSVDTLALHGYKNNAILSAGVKLTIAYEHGWLARTGNTYNQRLISNVEVIQYVENSPRTSDIASLVTTDKKYINLPPSVLFLGRYVLSQIDDFATRSFYRDLSEMRTTGTGDPRSTLLKRLSIRTSNDTINDCVYMLFRTWNAIRTGESLRVLKIISNTEIPKPI